MTIPADKYSGCLLGLSLGDALGAHFEGGPIERLAWRILGTTSDGLRRWTDDTQMSLDIATSIIANRSIVPGDIAERFASSYRWSRGYGPGAARVLKKIRKGTPWQLANKMVFAEGSFGNGAAMRSPVLALFCPDDRERLTGYARSIGAITHAHRLALDGAVAIAVATSEALSDSAPLDLFDAAMSGCESAQFLERAGLAREWLVSGERPSAKEVARQLGNGIAAVDSCVTALYLATRFKAESFSALQGFVVRCGGDVDTIFAMAGAIWGASNGASALPHDSLQLLEGLDYIDGIARSLHSLSVPNFSPADSEPKPPNQPLNWTR